MKRPLLVTGGTGFLGAAVCRELSGAYDLHVLHREASDRRALAGLDVTWHAGDLTDATSIEAAFDAFASAGAEPWVVHNAALISYRTRDAALAEEINVHGTRRVLAAARRVGVQRLLHVSSVVTVGVCRGPEALDEYAEWNGADLGVDYVRTKRAAEEAVLEAAAELDVRVVNPAAIYGPARAESNTARFLCSLARGATGRVAPPGGMSVVGVEDCARGVRLALEGGRKGRRYILEESYLSTRELFLLAGRLLESPRVRRPLATVPPLAWPAVVAGARLIERKRPLELATPQALTMLGLRLRFTSARARRELGWTARPFDDVLRATIGHLRETGRLEA
jgi:dihydroflavonol-4-reductase